MLEQGENLQPAIEALAKHFGWWNEQTQQPEYEKEPWTPDSNSVHCGLLAKQLGIRYRSSQTAVLGYIGAEPRADTGAIVATADIQDGDKAAAGRMASLGCAHLWLQTPPQYRPAQAPDAQEAAAGAQAPRRAHIAAALAQFTAKDIETALDVLTALHRAGPRDE